MLEARVGSEALGGVQHHLRHGLVETGNRLRFGGQQMKFVCGGKRAHPENSGAREAGDGRAKRGVGPWSE